MNYLYIYICTPRGLPGRPCVCPRAKGRSAPDPFGASLCPSVLACPRRVLIPVGCRSVGHAPLEGTTGVPRNGGRK